MAKTIQKAMETLHKNTEQLLLNIPPQNIGHNLDDNFQKIFQILKQQQTLITYILDDKKEKEGERDNNKLELVKKVVKENVHPELKRKNTSSELKPRHQERSSELKPRYQERSSKLKRYSRVDTNKDPNKITCYDCGLTFDQKSKKEFLNHVQIEGCSPYKCTSCGTLFRRVSIITLTKLILIYLILL